MRGRKPEVIPTGQDATLVAPAWMTRRQKLLWRRAIDSAPAGLLGEMDVGLLTNWVVASDLYREACEKMQSLGLIVRTREVEVVKTARDGTVTREKKGGIPIQNPYLPIVNKQAQIMVKAAAELGFTPISRTRLLKLDIGGATKVLSDEPVGKKEQRQQEGEVAHVGTDWESLLSPPGSPLQ